MHLGTIVLHYKNQNMECSISYQTKYTEAQKGYLRFGGKNTKCCMSEKYSVNSKEDRQQKCFLRFLTDKTRN